MSVEKLAYWMQILALHSLLKRDLSHETFIAFQDPMIDISNTIGSNPNTETICHDILSAY